MTLGCPTQVRRKVGVFFGGYGTGKSHQLQLVKATALRDGWVTAFVEFDPKAADPAKPQLVYRELMLGLEFPARVDGSQVRNFFGLVKEVRDHWAEVRSGQLLKSSPWFSETFRILRRTSLIARMMNTARPWVGCLHSARTLRH